MVDLMSEFKRSLKGQGRKVQAVSIEDKPKLRESAPGKAASSRRHLKWRVTDSEGALMTLPASRGNIQKVTSRSSDLQNGLRQVMDYCR